MKPFRVGRRFGHLVCTASGTCDNGTTWHRFRCVCGREVKIKRSNIVAGVRSCGCRHYELVRAALIQHGDRSRGRVSKEYHAWRGMITRCYYPADRGFKNYGARGIRVCRAWRHSFQRFLADVGRAPSPRHTIERRDVNVGYNKKNCCWATYTQQARNTRRTKWVLIYGRRMSMAEAAESTGLTYSTIKLRLQRGRHPILGVHG